MSNVLSTVYAHAAELRSVGLSLGGKWTGRSFGPLLDVRKGPGGEYTDPRPYVPGDDLRHLDRRTFQRTGDFYVYNTIAERELDVWFVVKQTPSMAFGSRFVSKHELVRGLIAAVALMMEPFKARYGLILAGDDPEPSVKVDLASSPGHLKEIDKQVAEAPLSAGGLVGDALEFAADRAERRSMFVLLSDLLDDSWQEPSKRLAFEHRYLVAEIIDPAEMTLPFAGLRRMISPDTDRKIWTWITRDKRARYQIAAVTQRMKHAEVLMETGGLHTQILSHPGWVLDLLYQVRRFETERRWSA